MEESSQELCDKMNKEMVENICNHAEAAILRIIQGAFPPETPIQVALEIRDKCIEVLDIYREIPDMECMVGTILGAMVLKSTLDSLS